MNTPNIRYYAKMVSITQKGGKTHWVDVFKMEKCYRKLKAKMATMKSELASMEQVSDMCL